MSAPKLDQSRSLDIERNYLEDQKDLWDNKIKQTMMAIDMARDDYNAIMNSKTPPPLGNELFTTTLVALTTLAVPQFAPAILIFAKMAHEKEAVRQVADAFVEVGKVNKDKYNEVKEVTETAEGRIKASQVAVMFFRNLYRDLSKFSNLVTKTSALAREYLVKSQDPPLVRVGKAHTAWTKAGLEMASGDIDAEQLGSFFLYDIMYTYTKMNVSLSNPRGIVLGGFSHLSKQSALGLMNDGADIEFEGLDPAKRETMYDRLGDMRWTAPKRPKIKNWKDLLKNWEFQDG